MKSLRKPRFTAESSVQRSRNEFDVQGNRRGAMTAEPQWSVSLRGHRASAVYNDVSKIRGAQIFWEKVSLSSLIWPSKLYRHVQG